MRGQALMPKLFNARLDILKIAMQKTVYYWTQDTTEVCFSNNHFWTALLLGVPGVLIVCIGIPAWFFVVLFQGRHDLGNLSLHRTYGFLYQGYK